MKEWILPCSLFCSCWLISSNRFPFGVLKWTPVFYSKTHVNNLPMWVIDSAMDNGKIVRKSINTGKHWELVRDCYSIWELVDWGCARQYPCPSFPLLSLHMEEDCSVDTYLVSFQSWASLQGVEVYLHPVKHKFPKVLFIVGLSSLISM